MYCKKIISFLSCAVLLSCVEKSSQNDLPLAQVYDSYLMRSEILEFLPKGTSTEDSLLITRNYIKNWITKQLLLHKAIENLSGEERQIQQQVEEYRTSLLIHNYKQKLIEQRLQEEISILEIENYYNSNKYNFILSTPISKVVYFMLPKSAPNLNKVKRWFNGNSASDLESLEAYCITNAKKFDNFNDQWIEIKYLLNLLPLEYQNSEKDILNKGYLICEDDEHIYFLRASETCKEHSVAPLEYVKDEITLILKNKKKIQFENELEREINREANSKNNVKIY